MIYDGDDVFSKKKILNLFSLFFFMILMKKNVFQKIQLFKKIRNSIIFKFILKREFFKKGKLENKFN